MGKNAPLTINDIGQFTDPGFDNPLNVGGETTERFSYSIDWGDGTVIDSGPGTIDTPGGPGVLTAQVRSTASTSIPPAAFTPSR